jgi:PAS domain S-box-containing protein
MSDLRQRPGELPAEGEQHFRALFENMSEGYAHCRILYEKEVPSDFEYLEVNKAFETLTGLRNVTGKKVSDVVPGIRETNPELLQVYGRVAKTGRPEKFETYVAPMGIWFSISVYSPARDHFVAVFENITKRRHAEEALRASEMRFRRLIENVSDMIAVVDEAGVVQYQSPSARRILGHSAVAMMGRRLEDFIPPEDHAKVREFIRNALDSHRKTESVEFRIRHRDGSLHILQSMGRSFSGAAGKRTLVVNSRDITESRQLEEKFRHAQRMESIGTLASGVAHDLNNILAPVLMAAGMLKDRVPGERDREMLAMVESSAQRGASIIRQLLTFSRGSEGARVCVQLRHLIKEMEHLMRETFPREIKIGVKEPRELWTVLADATQMHQVLINLCVNARDAMPKGGKLQITTENIQMDEILARSHPNAKPGPYVTVAVSDTGTGIPPENLERIFDPFFTTKGEGKGTGLGLSTVIGIVKSHGGFVTVVSEPNRGTTFKVYLPATGSTELVMREASKAPIPIGDGELVLVVDDEAPILMATSDILKKYCYRVLTAGSGEEAIKQFIEHSDSVALVLTDIMMPGIGGVELIRSLRIIRADISVVATSGLELPEDRSEMIALGVTEIISKPCMAANLLNAVRRALDEKPPRGLDAVAPEI